MKQSVILMKISEMNYFGNVDILVTGFFKLGAYNQELGYQELPDTTKSYVFEYFVNNHVHAVVLVAMNDSNS